MVIFSFSTPSEPAQRYLLASVQNLQSGSQNREHFQGKSYLRPCCYTRKRVAGGESKHGRYHIKSYGGGVKTETPVISSSFKRNQEILLTMESQENSHRAEEQTTLLCPTVHSHRHTTGGTVNILTQSYKQYTQTNKYNFHLVFTLHYHKHTTVHTHSLYTHTHKL